MSIEQLEKEIGKYNTENKMYLGQLKRSIVEHKKEADNWGFFTNVFRFLSIGSILLGTVFVYIGGEKVLESSKMQKDTTKS